MKYKDSVIFGCLLMCGLGASPLAQACSTAGWLGGVTGLNTVLFVGSPTSAPATKRYSELCGMRVTGTGSVKDNSPTDHSRIRVRFYVFSQLTGTGTAVLFRAYDDEADAAPLFEIRRNNGNLIFDTTAAGGAASSPVAAPAGWVSIEFDWQSGTNMNFWVNTDATTASATGTIAAGTGAVDSARLGLIDGLGGFAGTMTFDAYEAHSTTPVGLLVAGDANGDGNVNSGDTVGIINENLGDVLAIGQPDCNKDGNVNSGDTVCIINTWLGS